MEPWLAITLGLITLAGSAYGAYRAGKTSVRVKEIEVDGQAYTRAEQIYAGAIGTLQQQYKDLEAQRKSDRAEHAEELKKRDERLDTVEKEVKKVRDQNNALVTFVYKMLAILRSHNLTHELNPLDVPEGIHV